MKDSISEQLNELINEVKFSGVVSIKRKGEIIYEQARGYAERANKRPNNIETKFGIASGTKFFTALGIGKLIDEGKLNLDTKALEVIDYKFPDYDGGITIAQLLSHRSGMPDYFDEDEIEDFDNFTVAKPWSEMKDPKDYYDVFPKKKMVFEPGSAFAYNNGAYVLLAGIISKISGKRYVDYIKEEIFDKAGMVDSGFYPFNQLPENTASGYVELEEGYRTNIYNLPIVGGGDGGAFTTIRDLYTCWDKFLSGEIISKSLVEQYIRPYSTMGDDDKSCYGYGTWLYCKTSGEKPNTIYIEGCDAGISFQTAYNISDDTIYSVISNTTEGAWEIIDKINECL